MSYRPPFARRREIALSALVRAANANAAPVVQGVGYGNQIVEIPVEPAPAPAEVIEPAIQAAVQTIVQEDVGAAVQAYLAQDVAPAIEEPAPEPVVEPVADVPAPAPKPTWDMTMTRSELLDVAVALGVDVSPDASKKTILKALAATE